MLRSLKTEGADFKQVTSNQDRKSTEDVEVHLLKVIQILKGRLECESDKHAWFRRGVNIDMSAKVNSNWNLIFEDASGSTERLDSCVVASHLKWLIMHKIPEGIITLQSQKLIVEDIEGVRRILKEGRWGKVVKEYVGLGAGIVEGGAISAGDFGKVFPVNGGLFGNDCDKKDINREKEQGRALFGWVKKDTKKGKEENDNGLESMREAARRLSVWHECWASILLNHELFFPQ